MIFCGGKFLFRRLRENGGRVFYGAEVGAGGGVGGVGVGGCGGGSGGRRASGRKAQLGKANVTARSAEVRIEVQISTGMGAYPA